MRYTIRHSIETDADSFWEHIFLDPEFSRALHCELFGFLEYKLEQRVEPNGVIHRRAECVPKIDIPAAALKFINTDAFAYTEIGRYDPSLRKYFVQGVPRLKPDRVQTTIELCVEPAEGKRCEQVNVIENKVKWFGLGTAIEKYLQEATRKNYALGAEFTNKWIRDRGL